MLESVFTLHYTEKLPFKFQPSHLRVTLTLNKLMNESTGHLLLYIQFSFIYTFRPPQARMKEQKRFLIAFYIVLAS